MSAGGAVLAGPTDEELLAGVRAGDADSFGRLVARWERPLFHFVFRMISRSEDARDICQETFLRILKKADAFKPGAKFSTWMYQIALNLCRDQMRKRRRWSLIMTDNPDPAVERNSAASLTTVHENPDEATLREERRRAVTAALGQIPPEQREVLIMKEFEGLKFREIAEILGCPESTVKSRMYYGLNGLKAALGRRGIGPRDAT